MAAVHGEVQRLASEEARPPDWLLPPPETLNSPLDLDFGELNPDRARTLHERFHYLRSHRPGLHLAGTYRGRVAVVLSFSELDLKAIDSRFSRLGEGSRAAFLSRAWAAPWAPRNSFSHLLSLSGREMRSRNPDLGALLTYVNPGLGFDGASYRAANWHLFGREIGTRYAYLDEAYVTDRELSRRFGTSDAAVLTRALGRRIAFSRMALPPLDLYAIGLNRRLRKQLAQMSPAHWQRPWA
jgi:hypothetical protein